MSLIQIENFTKERVYNRTYVMDFTEQNCGDKSKALAREGTRSESEKRKSKKKVERKRKRNMYYCTGLPHVNSSQVLVQGAAA
jgi:hypothetical protein